MKKRNYGIDILRILSIVMIITVHLLNKGNLLEKTQGINYQVLTLLNIIVYCGTNCFALISGYVMSNSETKLSKILNLWFTIIFYTILITSIMFIIYPSTRNIANVINAIFPITRNQYWYLSSYFGMYLFIPILNLAIEKLNKKKILNIFFVVIIFMCLLPILLKSNPFSFNYGYSLVWLSILYLIGGYIKKYSKNINIKKSFIVFIISISITYFSKIIIEYLSFKILGVFRGGLLFVSYLSPTIMCASITLLLIFSKIDVPSKLYKLINMIVPSTLSIYIIHTHPLIWNYILPKTTNFIQYNGIILLLEIILLTLLIFMICLLIDIIKNKIFILLKINNLIFKIEKFIIKINNKLIKYIEK